MLEPTKLEIETEDGVAPAFLYRPEGLEKAPGVIMYPDAGSVRPGSQEMAARLSQLGFVVLLPHLFYRAGVYKPFDLKTVFGDQAERDRLMTLIRSLDRASAMRDAGHYIRVLEADAAVAPVGIGCVGYCLGGRLAFTTAGTYPDKVAAAASIHGGGIATDAEDSPHLSADKIRARLYFGIADNDPSCTPDQQAKLVQALATAHVRFSMDCFKGASHGFAMPDFPVYEPIAAEKHWDRIHELFKETLVAR